MIWRESGVTSFFQTFDLDPSGKSLGQNFCSQPLRSLNFGVSLVSDPPKCKVVETCNRIFICVSTTYGTSSTCIDSTWFPQHGPLSLYRSLKAHQLQIWISFFPMVRPVDDFPGPLISMVVTALGPCGKWLLVQVWSGGLNLVQGDPIDGICEVPTSIFWGLGKVDSL